MSLAGTWNLCLWNCYTRCGPKGTSALLCGSCLLTPELSLGGQRLTHYGVDHYLVAGRTPIKDDSRELPCGQRGFPPLSFLVSLLPSAAFLNLV